MNAEGSGDMTGPRDMTELRSGNAGIRIGCETDRVP